MIFPELETWLLSAGFRLNAEEARSAAICYVRNYLHIYLSRDSRPAISVILRGSDSPQGSTDRSLYDGNDSESAIGFLRGIIHGEEHTSLLTVTVVDRRPGIDGDAVEIRALNHRQLQAELALLGAKRIRVDSEYQGSYGPGGGEAGVREGTETFSIADLDRERFQEIGAWRDRGGREIWSREVVAIVE